MRTEVEAEDEEKEKELEKDEEGIGIKKQMKGFFKKYSILEGVIV